MLNAYHYTSFVNRAHWPGNETYGRNIILKSMKLRPVYIHLHGMNLLQLWMLSGPALRLKTVHLLPASVTGMKRQHLILDNGYLLVIG